MSTNSTLLCIHRDPAQLNLLEENGYELVTATSVPDGLRLLMSRPVDAVLFDYRLGLLNGMVAAEIKKVNPRVPIVMLADCVELPDDALKSVDALVTASDGPHFLWATVHFILNVKPAKRLERDLRAQTPAYLPHRSSQVIGWNGGPTLSRLPTDDMDAPFSPRVWRNIWSGSIQF